jgi:triacylglycerol lipase
MRRLANALERRGYRVWNLGYASRTATIAQLGTAVATQFTSIAPGERLHVITHSLGGIVLRAAVAAQLIPAERLGRVVMLGPPNGGSELVDALGGLPLFGRLYRGMTGPAGLELGTGPRDVPGQLPPVSFELGVIAGSRNVNPFFAALVPRPNDGKVSVASASVAGMRELIVMPHAHSFMMRVPAVIAQAIHFLECGAFER